MPRYTTERHRYIDDVYYGGEPGKPVDVNIPATVLPDPELKGADDEGKFFVELASKYRALRSVVEKTKQGELVPWPEFVAAHTGKTSEPVAVAVIPNSAPTEPQARKRQ